MKITMVLASDQDGGLEKHTRELSAKLVGMGHQVAVIAPLTFLDTVTAPVRKYPISARLSRHNPVALWQLWRQLKHANGEVIHAQANKAAAMIATLKPFLSVPLVATLHNVKKQLKAFGQFDQVITVSARIGEALSDKLPVAVIYNGIAQPKYHTVDLLARYQLPQQPVICAVGRLVGAKGFDVLLDAVDGLKLNLLIIGEGPDRAQLAQKISQLKAPTVVKLIGHSDAVTEHMAASDAVVIASRREGFSYVFVEALHARCRILSTDVPDVNTILPPSLIVPVESPQALASRLKTLLADLDGWSAQMSSAWQFAQTTLTCQAMAQQTADVYAKVLKAHAA